MPTRPASPCSVQGCPNRAVRHGKCERHQTPRTAPPAFKPKAPTKWLSDEERGTAEQRGYDYAWKKLRREILAARPTCERCQQNASQECHHIVPIEQAPELRLERDNVLALCTECHRLLTRYSARQSYIAERKAERRILHKRFADRPRNLTHRAGLRVVHLVGVPASGKSWLSALLQQQLHLPVFSIDVERIRLLQPEQKWPTPEQDYEAWCRLEDGIDKQRACVVETLGTHPNDAPLLQGRQILRVLCTADEQTRRVRLAARLQAGFRLARGNPNYVADVMKIPEPTVRADLTLDTSVEGETSALMVLSAIKQWLG